MIYKLINKINSNPKSNLFFISPLIYGIGNAAEQINIAASYAKKRNKKIIIIKIFLLKKILKYSVCNHAIFHDLSIDNSKNNKFIEFFLNFFVSLEFIFRRSFILICRKFFKTKFREQSNFPNLGINEIYGNNKVNLKKYDYENIKQFNLQKNLIDLKVKKKIYCENLLKKFKLDTFENLVCIHVRDHYFRNDIEKKNYRNSDINNYIDSIQYLIENNYKVIRMGKLGKKINFEHKNFIDYPAVDKKEDIFDLYLINKCKFFIGTQSGIIDIAYMFNKPVYTTNMVELYSTFPRKKIDRGIFKKAFFKKKNRKILIDEFLKLPFKYHDPQVQIDDINFIENNPDDILSGLIEFISAIDNNTQPNNRQVEFLRLLKDQHKNLFNIRNSEYSMLAQVDNLKWIRMFKSCKGYLCDKSLEDFNIVK